MARANEDIAAALREYADLLVMTGADAFRARNYEKAAKEIAGYPADLGQLPPFALKAIPGVGSSIAGKVAEYLATGTIAVLDELRAKVPPGVRDLARVSGVGPKRALQVQAELGIGSLEELEAAAREGRLRRLSGFGGRTEERILASLAVITTDRDLRDALGELPPGAEVSEIETVLAAQLGDGQPGGGRRALVRLADLRGDLHTHTTLTDGVGTLEDMITAGTALGYQYYAVTDHAPNLYMQQMTDEKILAQRQQVRELAAEAGLALLHGVELNIGPDGSVDWDEAFLAGFDICVASVHAHFDQDRAAMTRRLTTAAENPRVHVIGHPLARHIGRRPPVDVDLDELFAVCARTGTALEINASPARLDLPPEHIAAARDAGVKFAVDTDAHSEIELGKMKWGIAAARYAGLTGDDVINTWPLPRLEEFIGAGRSS